MKRLSRHIKKLYKRGAEKPFAYLCAVLLSAVLVYAPYTNAQTPRIANVFLEWKPTRTQAEELAQWDVVVLDMEVQTHAPELIQLMRNLNPDIVILAYITTQEIRTDAPQLAQASPLRKTLHEHIDARWWLTDENGKSLSWWPGTRLLNVTDGAGTNGQEQRWNDYLPQFVSEFVLSTGLWDGVFYDNAWDNISYYMPQGSDLNRDGVLDTTRPHNDNQWRAGMIEIFEKTRAYHPNTIIMGNGGHVYAPYLNGALFEHFSELNWTLGLEKTRSAMQSSQHPPISIINSNVGNTGLFQDYRSMRFGLSGTLLTDGYYSFDSGDASHAQTWYYDEYDAEIGTPKGKPTVGNTNQSTFIPGVWQREFSNGLVVLNAQDTAQEVVLPGEFEALRGLQDPRHNNGRIAQRITLDAYDGKILLRPLETLRSTPYANGAFVRVYNAQGANTRNGFFAYDEDITGGTQVIVHDVNADGIDDRIRAHKGLITVWSEGTILRGVMEPFMGYTGGLSLAIGDSDGDGISELVVGREEGAPQWRMYEGFGTARGGVRTVPNVPRWAGVDVAYGDVDNDGIYDVVAASQKQATPVVVVMTQNGTMHTSFSPYTTRFRGGVNVSVGDINGDGFMEIVTGTGSGGGPHVRVFDQHGKAQYEFFAGSVHATTGVHVEVSDVDRNGIDEILTMSRNVFTTESF